MRTLAGFVGGIALLAFAGVAQAQGYGYGYPPQPASGPPTNPGGLVPVVPAPTPAWQPYTGGQPYPILPPSVPGQTPAWQPPPPLPNQVR